MSVPGVSSLPHSLECGKDVPKFTHVQKPSPLNQTQDCAFLAQFDVDWI